MSSRLAWLAAGLVGVVASLGCSSRPAQSPQRPQAALNEAQEHALDAAIPEDGEWVLAIGGEVGSRCPALDTPTAVSVHSDPAWLRAQWRRDLVDLAACMKAGRFGKEPVLLRAHLGPTGIDTYGMSAGRAQAAKIAAALLELGVEPTAVRVERAADPQLELAHAREVRQTTDRRIDVVVPRDNDVSAVAVESKVDVSAAAR